MKITVPANRIKLFSKNPDYACSLPKNGNSNSEDKNIEGGKIIKKEKYVITTFDGDTLNKYVYEANRPAAAAVKSYFGFFRRNKNFSKLKTISFPENKELEKILSSQTYSPDIIVSLRKVNHMKIYHYLVKSEPNYHPNKHENEKGIFKRTVVEAISKEDAMKYPRLETYLLGKKNI